MKDKFEREIDYLRVSVTDNCNLRCVYCMKEKENNFLKNDEKLTDDEIYKIVKESAKLGIKKIRITGGEPLVRAGIVNLIGRINNIPGIEEIYLTTNGILLADKLEELKLNGLKGVNISLDSLKEERFSKLTRLGKLENVLVAIDKAIELGIKVKLNTVIVNDVNKDEIIDFVNLTKEKPIDIRFIELMPIGIAINYKGVTNEEKELAKKLLGLKGFLKDYSLIDEKKHIEVKIWEQYLIYAQLLGITKKVNKQMKDIYPESFRLKYDSFDFIANTYLSTILGIIFFGVIFMLAIMLSIVPYIYLKFLMEMNII